MSIIRCAKRRRYVVLRKDALENKALSLEAKGMWACLMAKPDNWEIHPGQLQRELGIGKEKLQRIMRELKAAGLYTSRRYKRQDGRMDWELSIHEEPVSGVGSAEPEPENPAMVGGLPESGEPEPENPAIYRSMNNRIMSTETNIGASAPQLALEGGENGIDPAESVLVFLNEKTGRNWKPTDGTLKYIRARLKEGATESQCRQVIANRWRTWKDNPEMREHCNPETLFRPTKFSKYLGYLG